MTTVQFRNLVFEGGGVKGIAYVGALQVLEQRGHLRHVLRVGGTSAGAINALILALGYTNPEQLELLSSTDFRKFMDDSFGVVKDLKRLWTQYGWNKGDFFSSWIGELIRNKLGSAKATFQDLADAQRPDLYVIGTNLSTGFAEVFSRERHPNMPLATAVRISMSIPLFFAAVRHGENTPRDVYVDGGVQLNYPVKLFDREKYIDMSQEPYAARRTEYYDRENAIFLLQRPDRSPYVYNRQTLGFRLDTQDEIGLFRYGNEQKRKAIRNFGDYAKALIRAILNSQEHQHLHSDDWQRTVYINTLDVGTTDFDITHEKKIALVREGIKCCQSYFEWFDDPNEAPVNRVAPRVVRLGADIPIVAAPENVG